MSIANPDVSVVLESKAPESRHSWEFNSPGGRNATLAYTKAANGLVSDVLNKLGNLFVAADLGAIDPVTLAQKIRDYEQAVAAVPDGL